MALSACGPRASTAKFQADLCGRTLAWEYKANYWDALCTGQLPGPRELTLALRITRQQAEPGLLQAQGLPQLVGRFALWADDIAQRADAVGRPLPGPGTMTAPLLGAAVPVSLPRTCVATVFGDKGVRWRGG